MANGVSQLAILLTTSIGGFAMAKASVDAGACVGCGACEGACPVSAIKIDGTAKVDEATCVECGACVSTCPVSAIKQ